MANNSTAGCTKCGGLASCWCPLPDAAPTLPPVGEREDALPAGNSPTRDAVCDLLTAQITSIGHDLGEACESQVLRLDDAANVRAFARILTMRDPDGRDGEFGEATRAFWNAMRDILASRPSPAPSGERGKSNATPNPNEV